MFSINAKSTLVHFLGFRYHFLSSYFVNKDCRSLSVVHLRLNGENKWARKQRLKRSIIQTVIVVQKTDTAVHTFFEGNGDAVLKARDAFCFIDDSNASFPIFS